ncbi:venom allergen 5-like [Belonocnema kinseyi]|uniref:venom allergen 5-like n=1 Tax=Belonocnema kinseyi TaxID=2817044 RepID=UPI00143D807F|nr:venom allergen 5-like [Belonocnema kinseyi]XP_033219897.1 venom allergen 5-like [Belonocnema kinseyi]
MHKAKRIAENMVFLRDLNFLFMMAVFLVLSSAQEDYCGICAHHTMCLYKNTQPICTEKSYDLTSEQKDEIVNIHNKDRQKVASGNEKQGNPGPQPPAKNMPNLDWDTELALIAQTWANQCTFAHDECRAVRRFSVGQNVAMIATTAETAPGLEDLIKMWYDEVALFDFNQVEYVTNFNGVGHYTQMLWANTTIIGCGYVNYQEGDKNTVLLVCNYGPAGNYVGEKMYEIRS